MTALKPLAIASLLLACTACGGSSNSPAATTEPSIIVGPQTALFEGTLDPGGAAFYSYTVQQTGNTSVMLASDHDWTSKGVPHSVMIAKPFAPAQVVVAISSLLVRTDEQR